MKASWTFVIFIMLTSPVILAQSLPIEKSEIIFPCSFREYGWRFYGSDGKKLDHPLQTIVDVYEVIYHLSPDSLIIWKRPYSIKGRPAIIYGQALNKADSQRVTQLLADTNLETLGKISVDDGLPDHAQEATVVLGGRSTTFAVYGEPTIIALLFIVDRLAPVKYKIYERGEGTSKK